MEFLVNMTTEVPDGTTPAEVADMRAREAEPMREILKTLPLASWLWTETVPLTRHPSDPAGEVRAS